MFYSKSKIQKLISENYEFTMLENLEFEGIKYKGIGQKAFADLIFIKDNLFIFTYNKILGLKYNYSIIRVNLKQESHCIQKELRIPAYIAETVFINRGLMYVYLKYRDGFRLKYENFDDSLQINFNKYFS